MSALKRGLTLVELLVALSLLAVLSAAATVGFVNVRSHSNDARRKTDVKTYTAALTQYRVLNGSYFVRSDSSCSASNLTTGCVGADGKSYGALNATATTSGLTGVNYPENQSIAQALQSKGVLANIATDPNATNHWDYLLIRCKLDGSETLGQSDDLVAVWARLENAPSGLETQETVHYCGSSLSSGTANNFGYPGSLFTPPPKANLSGTTVNVGNLYEYQNNYFAYGSSRVPLTNESSLTFTGP